MKNVTDTLRTYLDQLMQRDDVHVRWHGARNSERPARHAGFA